MSYSDLLERMMQRDVDAFLEFTDRYGWAIYSSIRRKHSNKVDADKVYHETMQQLWTCMQNEQFEDPAEALLCTLADQISLKRGPRKDLAEIFNSDIEDKPPVLHIRRSEESTHGISKRRKKHFGCVIGLIVLLLIFTFSVWVIVGFLMECEIFPYVDLGYSWFCSQLQQLLVFWNLL